MTPNDSTQPPESSLKRSHSGLWVAVAALVFVGLGVAGYFGSQRYLAMQAVAPPVVEEPQFAPPENLDPTLNPDDGDAVLAEAAKTLTDAPLASGWLSQPGMIRRLVAAVWQVGEGESPREPLAFLAPSAEYSVIARDGHVYQSPESEARYDAVAKAIDTVNAAQAGALYRRAARFAEVAFKEIAPSRARFTPALNKAIDRLLAVPLSDEPIEVKPVDKGVGYTFVAQGLEALDPAQKHLLRLGATNARLITAKLKALRAAAGQ